MCYNPIEVINPSKYVSLKYRDRFVMQVPCGKCAACMTNKSNEWSYRLYHHALATFDKGAKHNFVLFDTLTYDDNHLPHISDYIPVSASVDFPCFSSRDLRLFVADLRQRCKRKFKSNFTYFIASEYGTSERHLHRPHYHALFFVNGDIQPLEFSALVASTWSRGRTDGIPFQSAKHVLDNTFESMSAGTIRSLKYVCKYIQKSSKFQKQIDFRLKAIMSDISERFSAQGLESWQSSSHYWRIRDALSRRISQFHRQSTFLGADVLSEIDLNQVFETASLSMPDNEFIVKSIPLPTYFKRKLFYELVEIDGSKSWQPTELGYQYLKYRELFDLKRLSDKFDAVKLHLKLDFDSSKLADYVLNLRGRFRSELSPSTLSERLNNLSLFNYVTRYDREHFGAVGLSPVFVGNSSTGYKFRKQAFLPLSPFIKKNVYFDPYFDEFLSKIYSHFQTLNYGRQKAFEVKQRLSNIIHHFFS